MSQPAYDHAAYFGNEDATPERLRHARRAGMGIEIKDILLPTGMPSGGRRSVIERPLEVALRHGWIDEYQKLAGDKFLQHMIGSRAQMRFSSSRWEMAVDGGRQGGHDDSKSHHQSELRRATLALRSGWRDPFLDWMAAGEQRDTSIMDLGARFTEDKSRDGTRSVGKLILQLILNDLAAHFGYITRPTSWQTRQQLEELLRRNEKHYS